MPVTFSPFRDLFTLVAAIKRSIFCSKCYQVVTSRQRGGLCKQVQTLAEALSFNPQIVGVISSIFRTPKNPQFKEK